MAPRDHPHAAVLLRRRVHRRPHKEERVAVHFPPIATVLVPRQIGALFCGLVENHGSVHPYLDMAAVDPA